MAVVIDARRTFRVVSADLRRAGPTITLDTSVDPDWPTRRRLIAVTQASVRVIDVTGQRTVVKLLRLVRERSGRATYEFAPDDERSVTLPDERSQTSA